MAWNNRNVLSPGSRDQQSEIKVLVGLVLLEALEPSSLLPASGHCLQSLAFLSSNICLYQMPQMYSSRCLSMYKFPSPYKKGKFPPCWHSIVPLVAQSPDEMGREDHSPSIPTWAKYSNLQGYTGLSIQSDKRTFQSPLCSTLLNWEVPTHL